jgi:predicted ABC-type ATPase
LSPPVFHLLAGPNGAGKSTLYRALVANGTLDGALEFVNADLHERSHLQHIADPQKRSEAARDWADGRREALLQASTGFVSETVFSHASKLDLVRRAQALGYQVVLYVVSVGDRRRLLARVSQRVQEGGHPVPAKRILDALPAQHGPPAQSGTARRPGVCL